MIRKTVRLRCEPEQAFDLWTREISDWWPSDRRHTKDPNSRIFLLESGRFYERATAGHEVDLGRVREWRRPERLELDFYPGTSAERPTRVTIRFQAEDGGTLVTVEHRPTDESRDLWLTTAGRFEASWDAVLAGLGRAKVG